MSDSGYIIVAMNENETRERDPYAIECGERLKLLRIAIMDEWKIETIVAFVEPLGIKDDRLRSWEEGKSLVRPWFVRDLGLKYPADFYKYIYEGDPSRLPHSLAVKILGRAL